MTVLGTSDVCVVVPVYNEAAVLGEVLVQLREHFDEVVCVDDGSADGSGDVARAAGAIVLRHAVNLGQGAALQTGFDHVLRHTDAAYVVTFDGDGQHDPVDALRMVETARLGGLDVVLGTRGRGPVDGQPRLRRLVLRLALSWTRATAGLDVTDVHNGLRVLSRPALSVLRLRQRQMAHASELVHALGPSGLTWTEVPVSIAYTPHSRAKGQSNLNAFNIVYDLAMARLRATS